MQLRGVVAALFALSLPSVAAQMGMGSGRRQRDKEPVPVKEDVKLIKCDVCEIAMEKLFWAAEAKRSEAVSVSVSRAPGSPKQKKSSFSEEDVNAVLNEVCHRRKKGGEWIWHSDLVASGGGAKAQKGANFHKALTKAEQKSGQRFLLLATANEPGKWDHEAVSVQRACSEVFDDMDLEELVVQVWRGDVASAKALAKLGCHELSRSCKGSTRKPMAQGRQRLDAAFDPIERQLMETEQMMQNMEEAGSPMVMQSREDIEEEMKEMAEEMGMTKEEMEAMMAMGGGAEGGGGLEGGGMGEL